ncbi:MAG: hypothetical protein GW778_03580 [Alphaproteobacteria bacterium]|nr:hypothetical protein [Alphaproteobacteria bacterium]
MKTRTYLTILTFLCTVASQSFANETYKLNAQADKKSFMEEIFGEYDDRDGIRYNFAGDAEEEGALKLFVKNTTSQNDLIDPSASALSKISPAAGIQLNFEF